MTHQHFTCPVCGYKGLEQKPYPNMPDISETRGLKPPYGDLWGMGTYEVCSCCGFEFGADDEGLDPEDNHSFESYLKYWFEDENAQWMMPEERPKNWDLIKQLEEAGIKVPDYIKVQRQLL